MNKSKKVLEIEQRFGSDLGDLLKKLYVEEKKSTVEIGGILGVSDVSVGTYLMKCGISIKTFSEALLKGKQKPSVDQLRQLYVTEKKTTYEIAEILGISSSSINHYLREYKIPVRTLSEAKLRSKQKPSKVQLRQLYITEKKPSTEIAELFGVSFNSICYWLKQYNIPVRTNSEAQLKNKEKLSEVQLRQLYVDERKMMYEIAELVGTSSTTIRRWLKKYEIPIRTLSEIKLGDKQKPSKEQLIQLYQKENRSAIEIGKIIGISSPTVYDCLREYKIPIRNQDSSNELKRQALERVLDEYLK